MTDRIKGFFVTLDSDIRIDDVQPIMNAILQLKHVIAVEPNVGNHNDWMNRERVKMELRAKLWEVLDD